MTLVLDYVEIAVGDVGQAKAFYSKALGWTFNDYGPDYAGLQDPTNPGQEFGGLNGDGATSGGHGGVMALARTDDAERVQTAVEAAGGRIVLALYEYPGGRRFTFADPWGNVLGVYEPAD
jgi:predicted enzyme related to lactoylglutathione lyase